MEPRHRVSDVPVLGDDLEIDAARANKPLDEWCRDLRQPAGERLRVVRAALPQQVGNEDLWTVLDARRPLIARASPRHRARRQGSVPSRPFELLEYPNRRARLARRQACGETASTGADDDDVDVVARHRIRPVGCANVFVIASTSGPSPPRK